MKYRNLILVLLFLFTATSVNIFVQKVSAAESVNSYCGKGAFGIKGCYGFFTNANGRNSGGNIDNVFSDGLRPSNVDQFLSTLHTKLYIGADNDWDDNNIMGAAFIIDAFMGHTNPSSRQEGITWARNNEAAFAARVRSYVNSSDSRYGVDWSRTVSTKGVNSAHFGTIDDEAFHHDSTSKVNAIYFYFPGGSFSIERSCGNLTGELDKPPTAPMNWNLQPVSNVVGSATPGQTVVFNHSITNPASYSNMTLNLTGSTQWIKRGSDETVVTINPAACSKTGGLGSGQKQTCNETFTIPLTAIVGQEYCQQVTASPDTQAGGTESSGRACVKVTSPPPEIGKKPYFQVKNGDVSAAIATASDCSGIGGSIDGYYDATTTPATGSVSQIAALANAPIVGFASAFGRTSAPSSPIGLTFANSSGEPGGELGETYCVPSEDWNLPITDATLNINANTVVNPGTRIIKRVSGDVYINNNISYSAASFKIDNVPLYKIVADGDIYINSTVTALSGIFETRGTIFTCAIPSGSTLVAPNGLQAATICKTNKLAVQGSFIAASIKLLRTSGDYTDKTKPGDYAETFTYSPDVWLQTLRSGGATNSTQPYDAYTSLPPVL